MSELPERDDSRLCLFRFRVTDTPLIGDAKRALNSYVTMGAWKAYIALHRATGTWSDQGDNWLREVITWAKLVGSNPLLQVLQEGDENDEGK